MNGAEVLDLARDGIFTLILVSSPLLLVALIVGVAISLLQALTQIQEMTLVFVPKILAVFIALPARAAVHGRRAAGLHGAHRRSYRVRLKSAPAMTVNISFLPSLAAIFLLMFARLGTMVMLMPGLGERGVPMRIRLVIALVLTLVLLPHPSQCLRGRI